MKGKQRVAVLFGGRSAEHKISLLSARNVIDNLDRSKFELLLIGIDPDGRWFACDPEDYLDHPRDPRRVALKTTSSPLVLQPGMGGRSLGLGRADMARVDVAFPVLHGPYGEDGSVQGLFALLGIPCVGAGIAGSAICLDKVLTKRLLEQAGLPVAPYIVLQDARGADKQVQAAGLVWPVFVKPARQGSSVGISRAGDGTELQRALELAFRYDATALVEAAVTGREIECSVLGNREPRASLPGEIVAHHGFYSYAAKYLDDQGASLLAPADLDAAVRSELQTLAIKAFQTLQVRGMARVDFFLQPGNRPVINEINTIPGFTAISMYPKLWQVSGLPIGKLLTKLIDLALEHHREQQALKTSFAE